MKKDGVDYLISEETECLSSHVLGILEVSLALCVVRDLQVIL